MADALQSQVTAIFACRKELVGSDESFIKGWVVISVNQWNQEQERVLLLTDKACYRVKYNFKTAQIERFERTSLADVTHLQAGFFDYRKYSLTGFFDKKVKEQYGIRIFLKEGVEDGVSLDGVGAGSKTRMNPFSRHQSFRTFRALDCVNEESAKAVVLDMVDAFEAAVKHANPAAAKFFYISELPIRRTNYLGLISTASNRLGLGLFHKAERQSGDASKQAASSADAGPAPVVTKEEALRKDDESEEGQFANS